MTPILLFIDQPQPGYAWYDDPRTARELMYLVNTHQIFVGLDRPGLNAGERHQNAFTVPEQGIVTVAFSGHYVDLSDVMYQALFRLYDGMTTEQAAEQMGYQMETFEDMLELMYERFGVQNTTEMLDAAESYGVI